MHDDSSVDKYLVYQLGGEMFATPLIEVRAVIEYQQAKPVPHTAAFFKGVINIRGEIVAVIDLRERLGIHSQAKPVAQLVFETPSGPLAAIVDKVHAVATIPESQLDRKAAGQTASADRAYLIGIGKADDQLMTVVSLRKIIPPEQSLPAT